MDKRIGMYYRLSFRAAVPGGALFCRRPQHIPAKYLPTYGCRWRRRDFSRASFMAAILPNAFVQHVAQMRAAAGVHAATAVFASKGLRGGAEGAIFSPAATARCLTALQGVLPRPPRQVVLPGREMRCGSTSFPPAPWRADCQSSTLNFAEAFFPARHGKSARKIPCKLPPLSSRVRGVPAPAIGTTRCWWTTPSAEHPRAPTMLTEEHIRYKNRSGSARDRNTNPSGFSRKARPRGIRQKISGDANLSAGGALSRDVRGKNVPHHLPSRPNPCATIDAAIGNAFRKKGGHPRSRDGHDSLLMDGAIRRASSRTRDR